MSDEAPKSETGNHAALTAPGRLAFTSHAHLAATSSATATALSVAPDYGYLWSKLGAEFSALDDRVIQGLADETITWKRAGIPLAEEIAQITHGGSPEMRIDPQKVFRSFAISEQDRRKLKHQTHLKRWDVAGVVIAAFFGGGALAAIVVWTLTN